MKNCDFCEDMSKSKNANRVSLITYLVLNVLFFCVFESNYAKILKKIAGEIVPRRNRTQEKSYPN